MSSVIERLYKSYSFINSSVQIYNYFLNILRMLDVLPNFPLTTSEAMGNYYLQTWYIRVTSRVAERLNT